MTSEVLVTELARSAVIWLCAFLALELPPRFWKGCRWMMLTDTVRGGIQWWHPLAALVTLFTVTLWGHFERGWRVRYLILEGVLIAASILTHWGVDG